jgi:hypothetical protein
MESKLDSITIDDKTARPREERVFHFDKSSFLPSSKWNSRGAFRFFSASGFESSAAIPSGVM